MPLKVNRGTIETDRSYYATIKTRVRVSMGLHGVIGLYWRIIGRLQVYKVWASIPPRKRGRFSRKPVPIPPQDSDRSAAEGSIPPQALWRNRLQLGPDAKAPRGQYRRKRGRFRRGGPSGEEGVDSTARGQLRRRRARRHSAKSLGESIPPQGLLRLGGLRGIAWAPATCG
jgi:hypothetical protein